MFLHLQFFFSQGWRLSNVWHFRPCQLYRLHHIDHDFVMYKTNGHGNHEDFSKTEVDFAGFDPPKEINE
jgi:hypothetical protein